MMRGPLVVGFILACVAPGALRGQGAYSAEEVVVRSPYGHALGGTLTMPRGVRRPVPAVLLISGTGAQNRDASHPGDPYRPFRQIADTLSRRGIAVLRVDDRGIAEGRVLLPSALQVAEDARAALALLRGRGDIDAGRIGLVGHSEGGAVALMVAAADPTLRVLVLMGAPGMRLEDAAREQVHRSVARRTAGRSESERDSVLRAAVANLERMLGTEWARQSGGYDPLVAARAVRSASALVLQGANDWQVAPEQAGALAGALRAGSCDVTERVFPGINHLFLADPSGDPDGYEKLASQEIPAHVLGTLADWLAPRLARPGGGTPGGGLRPAEARAYLGGCRSPRPRRFPAHGPP
jgi:dienelactone hydrolase